MRQLLEFSGMVKQASGYVSPVEPLVISVKEARKILGANAKQLSDHQVEELVVLLTDMAEDFLQTSGSKVK